MRYGLLLMSCGRVLFVQTCVCEVTVGCHLPEFVVNKSVVKNTNNEIALK